MQTHNCPFCQSSKVKAFNRDATYGAARAGKQPKHYVRCLDCNARGPIARDEESAWARWGMTSAVHTPLTDFAEETC